MAPRFDGGRLSLNRLDPVSVRVWAVTCVASSLWKRAVSGAVAPAPVAAYRCAYLLPASPIPTLSANARCGVGFR